jgi:serine/threonine protein phosphatase PrpC
LKIKVHGRTERGESHSENEDGIIIDEDKALFAVADGVTLPYGGREASMRALKSLIELFDGDLENTVKKVNSKLSNEKEKIHSIGSTTLTAAHLKDDALQIAHIGDSSAFLLRDGSIRKITQDDSIPGTSMLTQVIGQRDVKVHLYEEKVEKGDIFFLATDGVTNYLSEDEIITIIKNHDSIEEWVNDIFMYVEKKPRIYKDDKSVIIISIKG